MNELNGPKASLVGLREMVMDGWLNSTTGELTAGVKIRPTATVIDVGCGDGGLIAFCARQGAEVIFVDRDETKLAATEALIRSSAAHAYRAIASDCDPIPLADGTGDVVICTEVLEHVPDPRKFLLEVVRVAKPGAQLVISVPDARAEKLVGATAPDYYFQAPAHVRIFSSQEFQDLLTGAGLQIESQQLMGSFWSMYLSLSYLTAEADGTIPMDNPHPITTHWANLWVEIQNHPEGGRIRAALNELIPRTHTIVARKPMPGK